MMTIDTVYPIYSRAHIGDMMSVLGNYLTLDICISPKYNSLLNDRARGMLS